MIKHKEDCLSINGQQSVNLEEGIIEFKNYFKQLPVPFKIYAGFECNLRDLEILLIKLFVLMIGLLSQFLFIEVNMLLMNLLKQFLRNINIAEK